MALVAGGGSLLLPSATAQNGGTQTRLTADYQKAIEIIRNNYIVETTDDILTKAAIQGMLKTLDPHSDYMDRKSFQEFNEKQHSQYFGIGSLITTRHRQTYIIEPFEDTPAYRAGFRYGDQIVAVDGKDTSTWSSDRVRAMLLGERGTQLTVSVKRAGIAEPITRTITRDGIWLPSIPNVYLVKPGVGYIGLTRNFQSTTSRELAQAMANLREKGAENFILDLRGNGGGYLDQAIRVCDQLLQRGQLIVSQRGRQGRGFDQQAIAENGASENFPLVVLIDRATASASEIVAGAIQDHDRGLIIGEPSFGKGLVQRIFPLQTGGALTLTIAQYFTPSGRLIQRDYSNGSLTEYYTRRTLAGDAYNAPKRGEEKKTDLGRPVFGGNGIEPDIKAESADFFTIAQGRLFHGLFMFTRELVNGQIAGASQFKLNGINHDYVIKGGEFNIGDDVLVAFREFALKFYKDNPDYGVTPAMIDENKVWIRKQLRQEVLVAAYGNDKAQQGMADLDLPLQRALAEMPAAADLAQRAWKRTTGLNRSK
ncbi:MAG: S41 family peptidase [Blastocatellia bacterium]|nr:S41 family peptidase [Blastocatellia bacterium]